MKPDNTILMLSLLIPVTADTNPEQVLNLIGQQVVEALQHIRAQQEAVDPESIPQEEFNASMLEETHEAYSDATRDDLLVKLGYAAEA